MDLTKNLVTINYRTSNHLILPLAILIEGYQLP